MIFSTSKKIVDFRFPARLIDAVPCTEILCLRTPYFHYGRAPRPRALSRWNFACFSLLSALFFFLFCSERGSDLHERGKHTDLPSFFRSRLPVKTMCSIDAYDENLKFWKPAKCEFWGVQNWTSRTDPRLSGYVCSGPEPHVAAFHWFLFFKKAMQTKFCEGYPLPVKARCSIDAYNGYLKCENLLNLNFWVPKIGPDALIRDPSPARAGTSRGGVSDQCVKSNFGPPKIQI